MPSAKLARHTARRSFASHASWSGTTIVSASFEPSTSWPTYSLNELLHAGQATRVSCSGTHTHEVVGTTGIQIGETYQGRAFLLSITRPACNSSFKEYVGHDVDGSKLAMTIVVPDQDAWDAKERRAVCLASFADGTAATGPMKGSGA